MNCLSRWAFVFLTLTLSQLASGQTPADQAALVTAASTQAKTLGGAKKQSTFDGIQGGASSAGIPKYGETPTETSFYGNGNGDTFGPGNTKVSNCASQPPNSDPVLAQECEAVNFAATNPSRRPPVTIKKTDPLISSYKSFKGAVDSNATAAPLTPPTTSNSTACTQTTETIPPVFAEKTCTSITGIDLTQQCVMGRAIDIATQANFQCDQTTSAYQTSKCNRTLSVSVTQPSAIPAISTISVTPLCVGNFAWTVKSCVPGNVTYSNTDSQGRTYTYTASITDCTNSLYYDYSNNNYNGAYAFLNPGVGGNFFINTVKSITPNVCMAGYLQGGGQNTRGPVTVMSWTSISTTKYTCTAGYTLSGSTCIPMPVISASVFNGCASLEARL